MGFCESVDKTQLRNLLVGMLGIYILYFIAGILHESMYSFLYLESNAHIIIELPKIIKYVITLLVLFLYHFLLHGFLARFIIK